MVTGAATATVNRLPVLLLPGDTFANRIPHPVLQQLEYPLGQDVTVNDCFRPVSRYFDRISRPEQLLSSAPEAMRVLADPAETGAVTLAFPEDTQTEAYAYPVSFLEKRVHRIVRQIAPESELRYAAAMIGSSAKPLIVAGGGVIYSEATDSLARFADEFGIPVVTTQAGNGSMPWNHPWYAGPVGSNGGLAANRLAAEADLVIAIGTRLSDFTTASRTAFQNDELRILSINVNAMDAHKAGSFPLISDVWEALLGLTPLLQAQGFRTDPAYGDAVESLMGEWNHAVDEQRNGAPGVALTQGQAIGIVNDAAEPSDVVVCAAGGMPGDLLKLWRPLDPKGYHVEYGFSCMGYEIAGGLGAKMADPDRQVFVMVGDGSYLMMNSELVTSIAEGMKITLVVVDNSGFQCIRGLQMSCGSPSFGNELRYRDPATNRLDGELIPIDFAANGASLGAVAFSASTPDELASAISKARAEPRSTVIHVRVDKDIRVPGYDSWWDVPIAEVSSEPGVQEALADYNDSKEKQRFLY
jgi:3D-(3,5/4)-trihydroxycyclohexane-1,2-dione acylhydrolase (decyclizing)